MSLKSIHSYNQFHFLPSMWSVLQAQTFYFTENIFSAVLKIQKPAKSATSKHSNKTRVIKQVADGLQKHI